MRAATPALGSPGLQCARARPASHPNPARPVLAGGTAWDSAGNPAAAAAAAEAATGAWLAELAAGRPEDLKAVAPGMGRGLFGGNLGVEHINQYFLNQ